MGKKGFEEFIMMAVLKEGPCLGELEEKVFLSLSHLFLLRESERKNILKATM